MTPEEAARAILNGETVRVTVGTAVDDPVLLAWAEDGMVQSRSIAGWSEGVSEPVCAVGSDYLGTFLSGRAALAVEPEAIGIEIDPERGR